MIRAIIWDFDGVIIESEKLHIQAEINTMRKYGIELEDKVASKYLGLRTEDYFRELIKHYKADVELSDMLEMHRAELMRLYSNAPLVEHVEQVLSELRGKYKMGLATSASRKMVELSFGRYDIGKYFEAEICAEEVERGKPDPQVFIRACGKLGVSPSEAVAIEDAQNGFEAAKKAGMKVIARRAEHNKEQDFSSADYVVEDIRELPEILEKQE